MAELPLLDDPWLVRHHPAPGSDLTLVCFPHAGGSASYFRPLAGALAPRVDVVSLQYPGRQDRRNEPCIESVDGLADAITRALRPLAGRPLAFFGHSMGAMLAFETARRLAAGQGTEPLGLVLSGRRAPRTVREENVHLRDDAGLIAEIQKLNGTDPALLVDEDILRMALPSLRADYTAVETYVYREGPALDCPVRVFTGAADPQVNREEAESWAEHTASTFAVRTFPGGHFYLSEHPGEVIAALVEELDDFRR
ncbi:thioesterase II family protein [Streptomyces sp. NPDC056503]|uniref:thioesterase II family protein n=1 Tax=Streptomyces sp. NPDC056503 TaxID=3345842 RepID=UPI00368514D3